MVYHLYIYNIYFFVLYIFSYLIKLFAIRFVPSLLVILFSGVFITLPPQSAHVFVVPARPFPGALQVIDGRDIERLNCA